MIEVHSKSAPDRCPAVGPGVPGKANTRTKIFVGTLVPGVSKRWRFVGQGIPKVGELTVGLCRDRCELVAETKVQGQIGASLKVVLEIKSEQVLAPAPDVIAGGDVSVELSSPCSKKIVQRIEEILPAVDTGQGPVALGSLIEHPHLERMASPRDRQVVGCLPDVMSKASRKSLACAIFGNPDRAKSNQAQL